MFGKLSGALIPVLPYLLYAQLILVCALVIVGGFLVLRRAARKNKEFLGDPQMDYLRIAEEVHLEVLKLKELRDRLAPGVYVESAEGMAAGGALTPEQIKNIEQSVEVKYKMRMEELEKKLSGGGSDAATPISETEAHKQLAEEKQRVTALQSEIHYLKEKSASGGAGNAPTGADSTELKTLQDQVNILEQALAEFELFEEELALVKRYKAENEELRMLLEGKNIDPSIVAPAATRLGTKESKVAESLSAPATSTNSVAPIAEVAPPIEAAPATTTSDTISGSQAMNQAELDAMFAAMNGPAPTPTETTVIAGTPPEASSTTSVSASAPPARDNEATLSGSPELSQAELDNLFASLESGDTPKEGTTVAAAPETPPAPVPETVLDEAMAEALSSAGEEAIISTDLQTSAPISNPSATTDTSSTEGEESLVDEFEKLLNEAKSEPQ